MSNKNSDANSKAGAGAGSSNSNLGQICDAFISAHDHISAPSPVAPVVVPAPEVEVSIDINYVAKPFERATRRPTDVPRPQAPKPSSTCENAKTALQRAEERLRLAQSAEKILYSAPSLRK